MKIFLHDFHGTPPHFEISEYLSRKNYSVYHIYSSNNGAPKNYFHENKNLKVFANKFNYIDKSNFLNRYINERNYGKLSYKLLKNIKPDLIILANTPTISHEYFLKYSLQMDIPLIFWVTDLRGLAAQKILSNKIKVFGKLIGNYFLYKENKLLIKANYLVLLNDKFQKYLQKWKIETPSKFIPIWGPVNSVKILDKVNNFSKTNDLTKSFNIVYTGSLGYKHYPELIVQLAERLKKYSDIKFVIISEGEAVNYIVRTAKEKNLSNIKVFPFQKPETFNEVLSTADILLSVLSVDASQYSVPSKVFTGFCAGRASLLIMPKDNYASRVVIQNKLGEVVEPFKYSEIIEKILFLKKDDKTRQAYAKNSRSYAEKYFNIDVIGKQFLDIIDLLKLKGE